MTDTASTPTPDGGHARGNKRDRDDEHLGGHWLLAKLGKRVLRPGGRKLTGWMVDRARPTGARVVEFAPGLGLTARELLERHPASYVGVDEDAVAVAATTEAIGDAGRVVTAKAHATGLDDGSADVVVGEAMLTMQGDRGKAAIIDEAARLLVPGGRYAIHELALAPDDVADEVKEDLRKQLARSIKVNARPLTVAEWTELFEARGFRVVEARTTPMGLLDPRQMLDDEGPAGVARIAANLARNPAARKRVLGMREVFTRNAEHLRAVSLICERTVDPGREITFAEGAAAGADAARLTAHDVAAEAPAPAEGDRPAIARLASVAGVNLIALRFTAGQVLPDHRAAHPITVQGISGAARFIVGDRVEELGPGRLVHLPAMVGHRVEADDDAVLLLSMHTGEPGEDAAG